MDDTFKITNETPYRTATLRVKMYSNMIGVGIHTNWRSDGELDREASIGLRPQEARELGEMLIKMADQYQPVEANPVSTPSSSS